MTLFTRCICAAAAVLLCLAQPTLADEFVHEANVMARLGNHPNIVTFIGASTLDLAIQPSKGIDNPLYQGNTMQGENPVYTGSADPGTPGAVQAITFELDNTGLPPISAGNGIVHRDVAARNFLVTTNQGIYTSAPGEFLLFSNDGPPSLRTHVGPIRWMAPESLRLYPVNPAGPNDWIEIAEFSSFQASYVPEPGSLALALALAGATLLCRRRRIL